MYYASKQTKKIIQIPLWCLAPVITYKVMCAIELSMERRMRKFWNTTFESCVRCNTINKHEYLFRKEWKKVNIKPLFMYLGHNRPLQDHKGLFKDQPHLYPSLLYHQPPFVHLLPHLLPLSPWGSVEVPPVPVPLPHQQGKKILKVFPYHKNQSFSTHNIIAFYNIVSYDLRQYCFVHPIFRFLVFGHFWGRSYENIT